jgi:hypothetical protein
MNGVIPVVPGGALETVGSVGAVAAIPMVGATLTIGTAAAELTPRLPISVDASGIPVRATPPGVMGDVGVDDEAMLLAPEPHIPDSPDVSNPEVVDIPDEVDISEDVAIPAIPAVAAVAGIAVPIVVPPPSKVAVDPNMPADAVPAVEHVVPLPGIAMVPVESVGAGARWTQTGCRLEKPANPPRFPAARSLQWPASGVPCRQLARWQRCR